jgi:hypothetical protein
MNVQISGSDGPVDGTIVGQTQVDNRPFVIVNLGVGAYIKGVYTRFAIVPTHLIMNRDVPDKAEVVNE